MLLSIFTQPNTVKKYLIQLSIKLDVAMALLKFYKDEIEPDLLDSVIEWQRLPTSNR